MGTRKKLLHMLMLSALGCGGSSASKSPAVQPPVQTPSAQPTKTSTTQSRYSALCAKWSQWSEDPTCSSYSRVWQSMKKNCERNMEELRKQTVTYENWIDCLEGASTCTDAKTCTQAMAAKNNQGTAPCSAEPNTRTVTYDEHDAKNRYGTGQTKLSSFKTSKAQPVEVCGPRGQHAWLVASQCADGSSPFSSLDEARTARAGNVGEGGRCKKYIDRYMAKCPEGTYEVFMDLYHCGPGEKR